MKNNIGKYLGRLIDVANNLTGNFGRYREYHEPVKWCDHEVVKYYFIRPITFNKYWPVRHPLLPIPANDNRQR